MGLFGYLRRKKRTDQLEDNWHICDSCGKNFSQSLKMIDFEHGPPKEIEVCPHCDDILTK